MNLGILPFFVFGRLLAWEILHYFFFKAEQRCFENGLKLNCDLETDTFSRRVGSNETFKHALTERSPIASHRA